MEWDDASRGKHSGFHEGVQYFTCTIPNSGSFVRPKKVEFGKTFVDAVQEVKLLSSGNKLWTYCVFLKLL